MASLPRVITVDPTFTLARIMRGAMDLMFCQIQQIIILFMQCTKVETYTETLYTTENHETYNTGGYTEGFKLFTSQMAVFYRRQLMKDLWMNADFVFGLNDIKENSFFKINSIERNTGIKLTLTYNLFKN